MYGCVCLFACLCVYPHRESEASIGVLVIQRHWMQSFWWCQSLLSVVTQLWGGEQADRQTDRHTLGYGSNNAWHSSAKGSLSAHYTITVVRQCTPAIPNRWPVICSPTICSPRKAQIDFNLGNLFPSIPTHKYSCVCDRIPM